MNLLHMHVNAAIQCPYSSVSCLPSTILVLHMVCQDTIHSLHAFKTCLDSSNTILRVAYAHAGAVSQITHREEPVPSLNLVHKGECALTIMNVQQVSV